MFINPWQSQLIIICHCEGLTQSTVAISTDYYLSLRGIDAVNPWQSQLILSYDSRRHLYLFFIFSDDGQYLVHRSVKIVIDDHIVEQMLMLQFFLSCFETFGDDLFGLRPSAAQS